MSLDVKGLVYLVPTYSLLGVSVGIVQALRPIIQYKTISMHQVTNQIDPERGNGPGIFTSALFCPRLI